MKKILCCDGGGVKGLITLHFLKKFEEDLLLLTGKGIYETFDIFGGSSIGALITSCIVYTEHKRIDQIINNIFTYENVCKLFTKNYNIFGILDAYRPTYSGVPKTQLIAKYFNDLKTCDTSKDVYITVYSAGKARLISSDNDEILLREILDAASAAPTYFPSGKFVENGIVKYGIDGAVVQNNPTDLVYVKSLDKYPGDKMSVLSISTGEKALDSEDYFQDWGIMQWATKGDIFNVILELDQSIVDFKMKIVSDALKHDYIRVTDIVNISLDDISKFNEFKEIGEKWYSSKRNEILKVFLN